jgi:hypothetical protein
VAVIRTDVSEDRIASIFRVYETSKHRASGKLLYRQRLLIGSSETSVLIRATRRHLPEDIIIIVTAVETSNLTL